MNCPHQQDNASIRSRWIYQAQQLVLTPTFSQYCQHSIQQRQQEIQQQSQENVGPLEQQQQQHVVSATSPLSASHSTSICLTSIHVEGGIQLQSVTSSDKVSALASTKCLPTTYNLLENLHRQHSFAPTHHQQSSLSFPSKFQSFWTPLGKVKTSPTTPPSSVPHWWSKTLDYMFHPWTKKQTKVLRPRDASVRKLILNLLNLLASDI